MNPHQETVVLVRILTLDCSTGSVASRVSRLGVSLLNRLCARVLLGLCLGLVGAGGPAGAQTPPPPASPNVTTYHGGVGRAGMYIVPNITWATAPTIHPLAGWQGAVQGHVWAQPLYWRKPGAVNGIIVVATDQDVVQALDSVTGQTLWTASLGPNVPSLPTPCPSLTPSGIKGTPVIDGATGAIYFDETQLDSRGLAQHLVYGLSLVDGSVLPGWPLNIQQLLAAKGFLFTPRMQAQRGALALVGGVLYMGFGGPAGGDCGGYHGWVVGLNEATPSLSGVWETRGTWGGIWSQGGVTFDGTSLFVTTGNTVGAHRWSDGEAVIRLLPGLLHSADAHDFFTPSDWANLDSGDLDIGSTGPLPIDVPITAGPGAGTAAPWLLAMGKPGTAYLLDRTNLGGINRALLTQQVATSHIDTAGATFRWAHSIYVAFRAAGSSCPQPQSNGALTVLAISANPAPSIRTAWCASLASSGVPTVTTSDGVSDPIVWMAGAEGDKMLHAFRGDTGQVLFAGVPMLNLRRFVAPLAAEGRLYVAADNRVYAFAVGTAAAP